LLNLLCKVIIPEEKVYFGPQQDIKSPAIKDISAVIRKLYNNRAPAEDSITAKLVIGGGRMLQRKMHILMERVWKEEQMPVEWVNAIIHPIYKKV
jgi:hypothetical protein